MLPRMKRLLVGTVLLLTLSACGSGGSSGNTYSSGGDLASAIGCSGYEGGSQELYVADGGTCTLDSNDAVIVDTFSSQDNATKYADAAKSAGGVYVIGNKWVVGVDSNDQAQAVIGKIGGKIH